ncbi:hypothetical protein YC2023_027812 [Brassica napus]
MLEGEVPEAHQDERRIKSSSYGNREDNTRLKTKTRQRRLHNLNREVEGLSLQYSELQNSSVQETMENEELRKTSINLKVSRGKKRT